MRKLILLILVGLLAGCGDPDYVEQPTGKPLPQLSVEEAEQNASLAIEIASGRLTPTPEDYSTLDIAPVVNGLSQPDGVINTGDAVVWLNLTKEAVARNQQT